MCLQEWQRWNCAFTKDKIRKYLSWPMLPDGYTESLQVPDKWYKDYRLSPSKEEGGNVLAAYQPTGKEPEGKWTLSAYLLPSQPCTDKDQTRFSWLCWMLKGRFLIPGGFYTNLPYRLPIEEWNRNYRSVG